MICWAFGIDMCLKGMRDFDDGLPALLVQTEWMFQEPYYFMAASDVIFICVIILRVGKSIWKRYLVYIDFWWGMSRPFVPQAPVHGIRGGVRGGVRRGVRASKKGGARGGKKGGKKAVAKKVVEEEDEEDEEQEEVKYSRSGRPIRRKQRWIELSDFLVLLAMKEQHYISSWCWNAIHIWCAVSII